VSTLLFHAHSGLRYLVLLAGLVAVVAAAASLRPGRLSAAAVTAGRVYAVLISVQFVLGLILLFVWPFRPIVFGHIVMMLAAVALAHAVVLAGKSRPPGRRSAALQLAGLLASLALVAGGILAIGRSIV
jgi:ABC-type uncharacterized transport system permease subunit